jgi:hypothetical protein
MSIGLAVAGIILLGFALSAILQNKNPDLTAKDQVKGSQNLMVDQEKIDLGDVPLGQPVSVKFRITNVGDQPLSFSQEPYIDVVAGC